MRRYAQSTAVPIDRSKAEIERTLMRFGASHFLYGFGDNRAMLVFQFKGKRLRFNLQMPDRKDFSTSPTGRRRKSTTVIDKAWEQAGRQAWRALALSIKAKLVAVTDGISIFEDEFLAWMVMPDGKTVSEHVLPQVESIYQSGKMTKALLPWTG